MIQDGKILTKDNYGYKVIKLGDGRIAKFFRLKRILSSALVWPYAKRFVRAVNILEKRGIPTLKIIDTYKIPSIKRDMVLYDPLKGICLRDLIQEDNSNPEHVLKFASFLAHLHNHGIYFRAVHFNNVIIDQDGQYGLIDVTELYSFFASPILFSKRVRNFKHILHYKEDRQAIGAVSLDRFLEHYLKKADFKSRKISQKFRKKILNRYGQRFE